MVLQCLQIRSVFGRGSQLHTAADFHPLLDLVPQLHSPVLSRQMSAIDWLAYQQKWETQLRLPKIALGGYCSLSEVHKHNGRYVDQGQQWSSVAPQQ